jgi:hypothetical protein
VAGSDPIAISVPAIVTPERHAAARAQLARNRATLVGRRENFTYLLSGLLRCGARSSRYDSDPSHGRRYYRHRSRQVLHSSLQGVLVVGGEGRHRGMGDHRQSPTEARDVP